MKSIYLNIFLFVTICCTYTKAFRGFIRPCKDTSPECLRLSLQTFLPDFVNGFPELGISSLDPFVVDDVHFSLAGGINIDVKHGFTTGLRKCIIDSVRKLGNNNYEVQFLCNLVTKGKYRSTGQFFMFPINGDGESTIISRNLRTTCTFSVDTATKGNGEQYLQINNFKSSHSFEGRVSFDMTNLFKGNSDMNKAILQFMNGNWKLVANEFAGPFFDYATEGILNNINKLLDSVPKNQLIKD